MSVILLISFLHIVFCDFKVFVPRVKEFSRFCVYNDSGVLEGYTDPSPDALDNPYVPTALMVFDDTVYTFNQNVEGTYSKFYRLNFFWYCHGEDESSNVDPFYVPIEWVKDVDVCPDFMRYPIFDYKYHPTSYYEMTVDQFTKTASVGEGGVLDSFKDYMDYDFDKGEIYMYYFYEAFEEYIEEKSFIKAFYIALLFGVFTPQVIVEHGGTGTQGEVEMTSFGPLPVSGRYQLDTLPPGCEYDEQEDTWWRRGAILPIWGRCRYEEYSALIGEDLVSFPSKASEIEYAFKLGMAVWNNLDLNSFVPQDQEEEILRDGIDSGELIGTFMVIVNHVMQYIGHEAMDIYFQHFDPFPPLTILKFVKMCSPFPAEKLEEMLQGLANEVFDPDNTNGGFPPI